MIGVKKSKYIFSILLFFGLVSFSACGENVADPDIHDENEDQFEDEVTPNHNVRYEFEDGQSIIDEGFVTASIGAVGWMILKLQFALMNFTVSPRTIRLWRYPQIVVFYIGILDLSQPTLNECLKF